MSPTSAQDVRLLVREATSVLTSAGVPSGRHDANVLACLALKIDPRELVLHDTMTPQQAETFSALVKSRAARVPLQHLTGHAHFRTLTLSVGPGVFIPRPETEVVVEAVLTEVGRLIEAGTTNPLVLDLCTGAAPIAASVAVEAPHARVGAVELSSEAYAWAARNLMGLGVDLRQGDARQAFPELAGQVDVLVSNPPYIPTGSTPVDPEVLLHDPGLALWGGGDDGLETMRGIVSRAAELLQPGGLIVVEHADVQGAAVCALLEETGDFMGTADHRDLADRPRFATARRTDRRVGARSPA